MQPDIDLALRHLQGGRLAEAERIFLQVAGARPVDPGVLHGLGVLGLQVGHERHGVELLEQAARLHASADVLVDLGTGYRRVGRGEEAARCYRRALELEPAHADALNNLGNSLRESDKLPEAEQCYRRALQLRPQFAKASRNLGNVLQAQDKAGEAERFLRDAIAAAPGDAEAHNDLANVLQKLERNEEAERSYRRALELRPGFADAWSNLGVALQRLERFPEAEQAIRQALALNPHNADTHHYLALLLMRDGRLREAEAAARQALVLQPGMAAAHNTLGVVLRDLGRLPEAEACYRRVLELKPDAPETLNNLGVLLGESSRLGEARAMLERALEANPDHVDAHNNLGNVHKLARRLREAERSYREAMARARRLGKSYEGAHSNLIFVLDLIDDVGLAEQQAERRRWHEEHAARFAAQIKPHANQREAKKKLRIGYVSADFRQHSACNVFAPMIVGYDRAGFEVVCYSGVKAEDPVTARLKAAATLWRSMIGVSDEALEAQIRADGIDVLVDLSGHSAGNRLPLFARKPAPVQMTAWGHATGTGLAAMDYFLTDAVSVLPGERKLFAEEVIDLPCVLCYEAPPYMPAVGPLPALQGSVTFGCLNRLEKVTDHAVRLWGRILREVPQSRLLVKDKVFADAPLREQFLRRAKEVGDIEASRVVLHGYSPHVEHLKMFNQVDVALDPFPQGGGVSTAEALWMGVPVVSLLGKTPPSRVTAAFLTALGMKEWIAKNDDAYVRIAVKAAGDPARLAKLREGLRARALAAPCGDLPAYVKAVEQIYRDAWRRWCKGK
jgi:predicted O-linked N-acetylglucosamine transferase (SPINDLY family)